MGRSDYIALAAAGLALTFSVSLWFSGSRDEGMFVGLWVPSSLAFACYGPCSARRRRGWPLRRRAPSTSRGRPRG
jgi:hypothetical protein